MSDSKEKKQLVKEFVTKTKSNDIFEITNSIDWENLKENDFNSKEMTLLEIQSQNENLITV